MNDLQELRQRQAEQWRRTREAEAAGASGDGVASGVNTRPAQANTEPALGVSGEGTVPRTAAHPAQAGTEQESMAGPMQQAMSTFFRVLRGGSARETHATHAPYTQALFGAGQTEGAGHGLGAQGLRQDAQDTAPCCRICFDSEETPESGRLFSPCRCSGSMRFVHVACLDNWRMAATNDAAYYRCDACHYEYRLQRVQLAVLLLSDKIQQVLTVAILLVSAGLLGALSYVFVPGILDTIIDRLELPPAGRLLFIAEIGQGNPGCWNSGFTYRICCTGSPSGNPACWDDRHNFETCCMSPGSVWQQNLRIRFVPLFRLLATGGMGLAVLGFAMYVIREVSMRWGDANRYWSIAVFAMWLAHFSSTAFARIVAALGSALAFKELYSVIHTGARRVAQRIGDRVLEVN